MQGWLFSAFAPSRLRVTRWWSLLPFAVPLVVLVVGFAVSFSVGTAPVDWQERGCSAPGACAGSEPGAPTIAASDFAMRMSWTPLYLSYTTAVMALGTIVVLIACRARRRTAIVSLGALGIACIGCLLAAGYRGHAIQEEWRTKGDAEAVAPQRIWSVTSPAFAAGRAVLSAIEYGDDSNRGSVHAWSRAYKRIRLLSAVGTALSGLAIFLTCLGASLLLVPWRMPEGPEQLVRKNSMLTMILGSGAAALVLGVLTARYFYLLPAPYLTDQSATDLSVVSNAITAASGLLFSLVLVGAYFPSIFALRLQARTLADTLLGDVPPKVKTEWLEENELAFNPKDNLLRLGAVLAPFASSLIPELKQLVAGG